MRRLILLTPLAPLALGILTAAASPSGPLAGRIEARKVVRNAEQERFLPADEARPLDVVEYRLTYANTGAEPLRNISVTDPIPAGTEYLVHTATPPQSGDVTFSIDGGKSYHAWPVRYLKTLPDGTELWADATTDMITHIRWTIAGEFEPETEITFSYRALVK